MNLIERCRETVVSNCRACLRRRVAILHNNVVENYVVFLVLCLIQFDRNSLRCVISLVYAVFVFLQFIASVIEFHDIRTLGLHLNGHFAGDFLDLQ